MRSRCSTRASRTLSRSSGGRATITFSDLAGGLTILSRWLTKSVSALWSLKNRLQSSGSSIMVLSWLWSPTALKTDVTFPDATSSMSIKRMAWSEIASSIAPDRSQCSQVRNVSGLQEGEVLADEGIIKTARVFYLHCPIARPLTPRCELPCRHRSAYRDNLRIRRQDRPGRR